MKTLMSFIKQVIAALNEREYADRTYIRVEQGRWTLNGKRFEEMTLKERQRLDEHIML